MRLIDVDSLVNIQMFDPEHEEWYTERMTIEECLDSFADEGCPPTIDAVEVVRCKDCQWRADIIDVDTGEMYHTCGVLGVEVDDEHYCSYGDRKTEPQQVTSKLASVENPTVSACESTMSQPNGKLKDEPQQKSCATCKHALGDWDGESDNCPRCCGADRRFYESIEDEPQMEAPTFETETPTFEVETPTNRPSLHEISQLVVNDCINCETERSRR